MSQPKIPLVADFCTVAYAAERIGVSQRQVRRWVAAGVLHGQHAKHGSRETGRRHVILADAEVTQFARAYKMIKQQADA